METESWIFLGLWVVTLALGGVLFVRQNKSAPDRIVKHLDLRFKQISAEVLEHQQGKAKESLDSIITPYKEDLEKAQQKLDKNLIETAEKNAAIQTHFNQMSSTISELGGEANNLARALSGEKVKMMGDWGEMRLERALELAGLQKDENFLTQQTHKSPEGDLRPDVVLKLPDSKAVVIDAKVSLASYVAYTAAEDEQTREDSIAGLQAAVKKQIDEASKYRHFKLDGHEVLDVVLMFMPVEGAWELLMRNDEKEKVFENAIAKRVILVGQANLLATLSTIMHIWRGYKLEKSTEEIRGVAAKLVDALELAVQRFGKLESQSKSGIEELGKSLTGKQGALPYAEKLRDLGVKGKKD